MAQARRGTATRRRTAKQEREAPASIEEDAIDIQIEELADSEESINWMIYGPSGHGKTALAGGAPNACFISTEKGSVVAKRTGSQAKLIKAPSWEHVVAAKKRCDQQFGLNDWVILDSLTKMQVLMIRWILRQINAGNAGRDLDIPAIQDHQKWQNYFKRFVDSLIDAPYNVIFICTDMFKEDQDGETIVLPAITGKDYEICNYVRAQMDIVTYYAVKELKDRTVRRALFQPVAPYVAAKCRYPGVFAKWEDIEEGDYGAMAEFIDMLGEEVAA